MRATEVLQKCLGDTLNTMHALRNRVLLRAVEATIHGRRLTLMDLARAWPGAERIRAPLKALDRLLGNRHLHAERSHLYTGMARWLVRSKQPVIVIDWSDLKSDGSWHLLRAAMRQADRSRWLQRRCSSAHCALRRLTTLAHAYRISSRPLPLGHPRPLTYYVDWSILIL